MNKSGNETEAHEATGLRYTTPTPACRCPARDQHTRQRWNEEINAVLQPEQTYRRK